MRWVFVILLIIARESQAGSCSGPLAGVATQGLQAPQAVPASKPELKPKALADALRQIMIQTMEWPENREELLPKLAEELDVPVETVSAQFGPKGPFKTIDDLIREVAGNNKKISKQVIDRKYFSSGRRTKLFEAVRNAENIILFKLGENQDLVEFEAILQLAEELNAPIIVAPAFADIGLIPERLGWLFEHPRVHVFAGESIQLNKNFHIINHGAIDKVLNPLVGLEEIFEPTDRVVVFHPRVFTRPKATGNYGTTTSYTMTTGSMSDPVYGSKFQVGMVTSYRAAKEAEKNLGLMVISRGYKDPKLGFVGGSQGVAPRRALYTDSLYGNPAGLFDLGKIFSKKGVTEVKQIPAVILGDIHLGATDPAALKAFADLLVHLKILERDSSTGFLKKGTVELGAIVLHDLIDGTPNNGHIFEKLITRVALEKEGNLDLENHVQTAAAFVNRLLQLLPNTQIVVPVDNHGYDWLVRVLEKGEFFKTHKTSDWPLLIRLMYESMESRINPYERIFQYYGVNTDRIRFLRPTDNYRIGIDLRNPNPFSILNGVEGGQHTHMGRNGAKSISLKGMLQSYGASIGGHTHATEENGLAKRVGTATPKLQGYHRGPSGSDPSVGIVYGMTAIQILRMEKASFFPNAPGVPPEEFFPTAAFPIIKDPDKSGGAVTDQFRSDPPTDRGKRLKK